MENYIVLDLKSSSIGLPLLQICVLLKHDSVSCCLTDIISRHGWEQFCLPMYLPAGTKEDTQPFTS